MPDAGVLATILLIVGLSLLALELMIPSFGIIGILSALSLLISAWCAWQAWWGTSPGFFWTYAAFWLLGIPGVLGGVLFLLQNTSLGDRLVLRGPVAEVESPGDPHASLPALVGQVGITKSLLTPGGIVMVDEERHHAESPGMVIEPNTPVKVVGIRGNRLMVRTLKPEESVAATEQNERPAASQAALADTVAVRQPGSSADEPGNGSPSDFLDFDIPDD